MPEDDVKTEEKAEGATAPVAASSGGFKAWLPLIIIIVLMPALAFGVAGFVILPQLQKGLGIKTDDSSSGGESRKESAGAKQESVLMNKMLVNVSGTMGARYLLVS